MALIEIDSISKVPTTGKVVVVIINGFRAPCKKFVNTTNQSIGIIESANPPAGGLYFLLQLNNDLKDSLFISAMPIAIVYVNGVEKKRWSGHWYSEFQIANMIREGFSKE
jgi:hypothetical protein